MISHLWIVTKATATSQLDDICIDVSLAHDLCDLYLSGLDPDDVVGFYESSVMARLQADHELRLAKRKLEKRK